MKLAATGAEQRAAPAPFARATLLLLAAAFLPFLFTLPPWVTAAALGLLVWRGAALYRRVWLPGTLPRLALLVAALAGVLGTFRAVGGAEAGGAFLLLTTALKALESRSVRDFRLALLLVLLLVGANFLLAQSLPVTLYAAALIWGTLTLALRPGAPAASTSGLVRRSATLLAAAFPVATAFFLLFPRLPGPLFQFGAPRATAISGLSNRFEPGSIADLVVSDAVAFRIRFERAVPPPAERYFRGPVFTRFDGRRWYPAPRGFGTGRFQPRGAALHFEVLERANGTRYLFAPALPDRVSLDSRLTGAYELLARRPIYNDLSFSGVSYPHYLAESRLTPAVRARLLALPPGIDPRTRALAADWRREAASPLALVRLALAWFADKPYYYTLTPPLLRGRNQVDQFLFDTRSGFCEHYASAFAVLMRAAGIPARIVTGYAGGEINPYDGWLVLRQRNAHAWDEVWLAGRGWVRVDPTAVIPPQRVEPSARPAAAAGAVDDGSAYYDIDAGFLAHVRNLWDAANTVWMQYFVGYGPVMQQRFLARLGLRGSAPVVLALAMVAAAAAAGLLAFVLSLLAPRSRHPDRARRLYDRWCRRLARTGLVRRPHEGPLAFLARIAAARPDLYADAAAITGLYVRARYAEEPLALHALRRELGRHRRAPAAPRRAEEARDQPGPR